jgi:hypothetical protein
VPITHRLTVLGRDYYLPDPVGHIKSQILEAVLAGGGYVHIPPLSSGTGVDILFSPGMPVVWSSAETPAETEAGGPMSFPDFAEFSYLD